MALSSPLRALFVVVLAGGLAACGEGQKTASEKEAAPTLFETGHKLVETVCAGCHAPGDNGVPSRIGDARKSPEGWDMTLARMMIFHGLELSADDRRAIVKYLSDTRGLAPSESAPFRYALERRTEIIETGHDENLMVMCARCHSYARVGLQRRDAPEWKLLVNMHVGQWPTLEYQLYSRDRDWLADAEGPVSAELAKLYPLATAEWEAWQAAAKPSPVGRWRYISYSADRRLSDGILTVAAKGPDSYTVSYETATPGGGAATVGTYTTMIYTGYEWRGRGKMDNKDFREVATLAADGQSLNGRWFWAETPETGGDLHAVRMDKGVHLLGLSVEGLKRGTVQEVTFYGTGLEGTVDFGKGVTVEPVSATPETVVVKATVAADAPLGRREVRVGTTTLDDSIAIYDQIGRIEVSPAYAVARVGGAGGHVTPVAAQFTAVAYNNGPDGKPGTNDDFRIGVVKAEWDTAPANAVAAKLKDQVYAGKITPQGQFLPGPAGPNPERPFKTGNMGDLKILATVEDEAGHKVTGEGRLIVTAPRWNNPPIY